MCLVSGFGGHEETSGNDLWQHDNRLKWSAEGNLECSYNNENHFVCLIMFFHFLCLSWYCSDVCLFSIVHEICMDGTTSKLSTSLLPCIQWGCTVISTLPLGKGEWVCNLPFHYMNIAFSCLSLHGYFLLYRYLSKKKEDL